MAFPVLPRLDGASDGQLETAGPFGVVWLLFTEFYWFSFLGFMFLFFFLVFGVGLARPIESTTSAVPCKWKTR